MIIWTVTLNSTPKLACFQWRASTFVPFSSSTPIVFTTLHSFCVHHFLDLLVLSCAWQMSYCGILFVLKFFRYLYYCMPSARTCYVALICFQRFIPAVMTRGSLFHFMVTLYPIMWICPSLFIHFFVNVIWIRTTFGEVCLSFSVSLFLSSQTLPLCSLGCMYKLFMNCLFPIYIGHTDDIALA